MKVALKFKPEAFKEKVSCEIKGKVRQRINFPVQKHMDMDYLLLNSIELVKTLDDRGMELAISPRKASCIVDGEIRKVYPGNNVTRIILSPQGEIQLLDENEKSHIQRTSMFPQRFLSVGDFWETPIKVDLPYFVKPFNVIVRSALENFECYDKSKICVIINNTFYSSEERSSGKFSGKETAYFDYEAGRLVKSIFSM